MEVWHQMLSAAQIWFLYHNVSGLELLVAAALAIAFGAVWLTAHWPPIFRYRWFWVLGVFSAFFTMAAFAFINTPLQFYYSKLVKHFLNAKTVSDWILLLGIPSVLFSGLVQEGAKMVGMVLYWRQEKRRITPAMGMALGAVVGVGFGIFNTFQIFSAQFGAGWTTAALSSGFNGIAGFWVAFFTIGLNTALSAMVGYGLARGKGWQYFLVAGGFHALFLYGHYFNAENYFDVVQLSVYIAVIAVILSAIVLLVRYRLRRDYPGDAAYDPVLYLEQEERYAEEAAAAMAEASSAAYEEPPSEEDAGEDKPD